VRVPTLREALEWTEANDLLVNVELKSFPGGDPNLTDTVLDLIETTGTGDRVLISSFDHSEVARVVRRGPGSRPVPSRSRPWKRRATTSEGLSAPDAYHISDQVAGRGGGCLSTLSLFGEPPGR